MTPLSPRPVRPRSSIKTKRHALMGTACALGLLMVPVAGSAVVVAVTTSPHAPAATAQVAAAPLAAPAPVPVPVTVPVTAAPQLTTRDRRQARPGR